MSNFYPIYLNLKEQPCLVVGAGQVAERKIESLLECGAIVTVIGPEATDLVKKRANEKELTYLSRHYQSGDITGYFLVISATDNEEANRSVAQECFAAKTLVNVVDDPPKCNFIVPSVFKRGSLSISVSTEGKSPVLARKIREQLELQFGPEYAEFLDLMGELRGQIIKEVQDINIRKRIFIRLVESDILDLLRQGRNEDVKERIEHVLNHRGC